MCFVFYLEEYLHKTLDEKSKEGRLKHSEITSLDDIPTWRENSDKKALESQSAKSTKMKNCTLRM